MFSPSGVTSSFFESVAGMMWFRTTVGRIVHFWGGLLLLLPRPANVVVHEILTPKLGFQLLFAQTFARLLQTFVRQYVCRRQARFGLVAGH